MSTSLDSSIIAILISFCICAILGPFLIPMLQRLKFGQNVRDDGPKTHLKKTGTPTMGGILIIISFFIGSLFFLRGNFEGLAVVFITVCFGLIGFLDDYISVVKKRSLGLKAYQKIILQLIVTTIFLIFLLSGTGNNPTSILVPFTNDVYINLGALYIPFVYIVVLGTVNGVNLTDGLDGLATGVTALVATFFLCFAISLHSPTSSIVSAMIGALMGFLLFNSFPAKVFMGDTGSLALGGFIAAVALILKMPLFLLIVGIIYILECVTVIIQVLYFKSTGRRFFKMAPFHHSLELSGWSETRVVTLFYIITAIACLIGFFAATIIG